MCQKVYSIADRSHALPSKWYFCDERSDLEIHYREAYEDSRLHERQLPNAEHDGEYLGFCCSFRCCNDALHSLQHEQEDLEHSLESIRRRQRRDRVRLRRAYDNVMQSIDEIIHAINHHRRCTARREHYFERLRFEQPLLS